MQHTWQVYIVRRIVRSDMQAISILLTTDLPALNDFNLSFCLDLSRSFIKHCCGSIWWIWYFFAVMQAYFLLKLQMMSINKSAWVPYKSMDVVQEQNLTSCMSTSDIFLTYNQTVMVADPWMQDFINGHHHHWISSTTYIDIYIIQKTLMLDLLHITNTCKRIDHICVWSMNNKLVLTLLSWQ